MMGSTLGLQVLFFNLAICLILFSSSSFAQTNCTINHECGNVSIPFPFGTTKDCSLSDDFLITCNRTFTPPKAFLQHTNIKVTHISLDGQLKVLQFIANQCYARNWTSVSDNVALIRLPDFFTVNNTANKFTVIGCDTYGSVSGNWLDRTYETGCSPMCVSKDDLLKGSCTGLGCCQLSIPKHVSYVELGVSSFSNYSDVWEFNDCGYAFVVEESAFSFSPENLTNLKNVEKLPMVVDWVVGNGTCEKARNSSSYACKSVDSECYSLDNGVGYRCSCRPGYRGNPYLVDGCEGMVASTCFQAFFHGYICDTLVH